MEIVEIVSMLAIGAIAGWLAGMVMKGGGFGLIGNIILGIVGAVVGTFIGGLVSGVVSLPFTGLLGTLIWAVIGAIVSASHSANFSLLSIVVSIGHRYLNLVSLESCDSGDSVKNSSLSSNTSISVSAFWYRFSLAFLAALAIFSHFPKHSG